MDYNKKKKDYFKNVRYDVLSLHNFTDNTNVLEIGSGHGSTLLYLKEKQQHIKVIGVDIVTSNNVEKLDNFFCLNIEKENLPKEIQGLEVVIFADVLEHLYNPKIVLEKIKKRIVKSGNILVSMPNIRNVKSMIRVFLKGDFSYEEEGVFDYTHVRFYCKKDIKKLIESSGYKIEKITSDFKIHKGKAKIKFLNMITFGVFEEFLTVQYLIKASKVE